jgi:hypothetical protein
MKGLARAKGGIQVEEQEIQIALTHAVRDVGRCPFEKKELEALKTCPNSWEEGG